MWLEIRKDEHIIIMFIKRSVLMRRARAQPKSYTKIYCFAKSNADDIFGYKKYCYVVGYFYNLDSNAFYKSYYWVELFVRKVVFLILQGIDYLYIVPLLTHVELFFIDYVDLFYGFVVAFIFSVLYFHIFLPYLVRFFFICWSLLWSRI